MKKTVLLLGALCALTSAHAQTAPFGLFGYASQTTGTTGGTGGAAVTVSTGTALMAAIRGNTGNAPLTIYVNGTITPANTPSTYDKIEIKDRNNISIIGVGTSGEFHGIGLYVRRASNIIIQNIKVHHVLLGPKDCIGIEGPADHIWVDHCELYNQYQGVGVDDYDGLLDAKDDCQYLTYSWNYLHDAWKASLCGYTETDTYDRKITYHHNRFENINSRLPLYRGGTGHVFNNYYKDVASTAINSRVGACLRIENNYFDNVHNPYVSAYSSVVGYGHLLGNALTNGSTFQYSNDTFPLGACASTVPYAYSSVLNPAADVPTVVLAGAGIGKIGSVTSSRAPQTGQFQAYPNPFRGATTFEVVLPLPGPLSITLYTATGQRVAEVTPAGQQYAAGVHRVAYHNPLLRPGTYYYTVRTAAGTMARPLLVE
jgi:pectate lyase